MPILWQAIAVEHTTARDGAMRVKEIISKSRDGDRMEVIATDGNFLHTFHIQRYAKKWKYCEGYIKGQIILGTMQ